MAVDGQPAHLDTAPGPYQALYRRFRPQRFADVLGQEHVTRALRAAVRDGKVAHAYLFSGPRGTGKTSTARILAMALNCERPDDGEPCGVCESCVAVRRGVSLDVQELDSATNRGIDEMRDLLSRVALGSPGRWKVYIVDEVHQITSAAASALLKTLEEPPAHVIFVLATTDPQKVLETIRSRAQHFEFRLLASDVLASLLADVARRAVIDLPPEALDVVVRRGHGSARDALSALDQVAAAGSVEDEVEVVSAIVESLIERDPATVLVRVAEATRGGLDPRRLGAELVEHLRNAFLATRAPSLVMLAAHEAADAADQAKRLGPAMTVRAMELVGQALIDMRDSADPRTTLEVSLVRLADPEVDDSRAALLERVERLERAIAGISPPPARAGRRGGSPAETGIGPSESGGPTAERQRGAAAPIPPAGRSSTMGPPPPLPGQGAAVPTSNTADSAEASSPGPGGEHERGGSSHPASSAPSREELTLAWGDHILPSLRPGVKVYVATGRFLSSDGGSAVYAVPDRGLLSRAEANRSEVEAALGGHFGRPVPLRLVLDDGSTQQPAQVAPSGPARASTSPPGPPDDRRPDRPSPVHDTDDSGHYDWDNLEEAQEAVVSPEQRLLEAFPGAEEVPP